MIFFTKIFLNLLFLRIETITGDNNKKEGSSIIFNLYLL